LSDKKSYKQSIPTVLFAERILEFVKADLTILVAHGKEDFILRVESHIIGIDRFISEFKSLDGHLGGLGEVKDMCFP
jgi:hypothetical protein